MRVPLSKVYRAFPELDDLTEAQCQLLMRRIDLQTGYRFAVSFIVLALYVALLFITGIALSVALTFIAIPNEVRVRHEMLYLAVCLCITGFFPAAVCFFVRDTILRRRLTAAINYEVDRVRCLNCRYILIGQVASGGRIGCPECGASFALGELGITEADLLPPVGAGTAAG